LTLERVTSIADGRIFSGAQAKQLKLVDELGTLQDAINEAGKEAGIKGKPDVVYPSKRSSRLLDLVLDDGTSRDENSAYGGGVLGVLSRVLRGTDVSDASDALGEAITGTRPGIYWL